MSDPGKIKALVADDEPLLADALIAELKELWPDLDILDPVGDGDAAIAAMLTEQVQVAFLDISMPGCSGLEVAQAIAEDWVGANPPMLVFVTAHDEFALKAFELAALDYITKPVTTERLAKTVQRLRDALATSLAPDIDRLAGQINQLLGAGAVPSNTPLTVIRASVGDTVQVIPIADVVMFEAADKYVNVATANGNALIRESLRDLLPKLDASTFVQIHRSRIVNMRFVDHARRGEDGKLRLSLRDRAEQPVVSRLFTHLFKAM